MTKKSPFVIVYHRQPYEEVVENGRVVFKENKSPNGIVPALKGFFGTAKDAVWVAWKQLPASGKPNFERTVHVKDSYGEYDVVRLPLTAEQVKAFYHVTSKEALWPILHSFPGMFNYGPADWENFREVNRLFAEAACEQAADDALIWVHDYNLWLVPHYVRQIKPNARIAFFHHTPFPAADIFNVLPWREEILTSLLSCDVVGFHIPRYAENFASVAC
jgi:glucosylglycerol-phosphate synthase